MDKWDKKGRAGDVLPSRVRAILDSEYRKFRSTYDWQDRTCRVGHLVGKRWLAQIDFKHDRYIVRYNDAEILDFDSEPKTNGVME